MKQRKRVVIFSGGALGDWALAEVRDGDTLVGADRGALFLLRHGLKPHMALGDFDSVTAEERGEIREASGAWLDCDPVMKDFTDTEMAMQWALAQQPEEIVLLGALGTRFDHSLANVQLLWTAHQAGVRCAVVDENNEVTLVERYGKLRQNRFPQVSLLPLSMKVTGITLEGFLYPLRDATLVVGESRGVSNKLVAEEGHIYVGQGQLLVIRSRDEAADGPANAPLTNAAARSNDRS